MTMQDTRRTIHQQCECDPLRLDERAAASQKSETRSTLRNKLAGDSVMCLMRGSRFGIEVVSPAHGVARLREVQT